MKNIFVLFLFFLTTLTTLTSADFKVRVIVFTPKNEVAVKDNKVSQIVLDTQQLFADEMVRHGFSRKTFNLEKTANGVRIHKVAGKNPVHHYINSTYAKIENELPDIFDMRTQPWSKQDHVHLIIVSGLKSMDGWKWGIGFPMQGGRYGGGALIAEKSGHFNVHLVAHELSHCFGLYHKDGDTDPYNLEYYEARWLDKHYQFSKKVQPDWDNIEFVGKPTLVAKSQDDIGFSITAKSERLGLHQMIVLNQSDIITLGYDYLSGEKQIKAETDTKRNLWKTAIYVQIMDLGGNWKQERFNVSIPKWKEKDQETIVQRTDKELSISVSKLNKLTTIWGRIKQR